VAATALGFAGTVSESHVYATPNIPALREAARQQPIPLAEMIMARTGIPTVLGNDANLAALGEFTRGAGRGADPMAFITWSTGVGAGYILNGQIFVGATGAAAESGHEVVDLNSELTCGAGHRGDVEAIAGGDSIRRRAVRAIAEGGRGPDGAVSILMSRSAATVTTADVFAAANRGDRLAVEFVHDASRAMGALIANVINTWNPQSIVIGGGVTKSAGEAGSRNGIWETIMDTAQSYVGPQAWAACHVRGASLSEPGLVGAVALAAQFAQPLKGPSGSGFGGMGR